MTENPIRKRMWPLRDYRGKAGVPGNGHGLAEQPGKDTKRLAFS